MGYLDDYAEKGAEAARRERARRRTLLSILAVLLVAGSLYFWFKNYREEKRIQEFLAALQRSDYPAAYSFWGCRVETPCPNYNYKDFMDDWGPKGEVGPVSSFRLGTSHERGSGVVITVELNGRLQRKLWVEKKTEVVGFAPPMV